MTKLKSLQTFCTCTEHFSQYTIGTTIILLFVFLYNVLRTPNHIGSTGFTFSAYDFSTLSVWRLSNASVPREIDRYAHVRHLYMYNIRWRPWCWSPAPLDIFSYLCISYILTPKLYALYRRRGYHLITHLTKLAWINHATMHFQSSTHCTILIKYMDEINKLPHNAPFRK